MTVQLKVNLPVRLAAEAKAVGLLEAASVERMLRQEILRRKSVDRLFDLIDRLKASPLPGLTPQEVEAEIQAVRALRRKRRAHRH